MMPDAMNPYLSPGSPEARLAQEELQESGQLWALAAELWTRATGQGATPETLHLLAIAGDRQMLREWGAPLLGLVPLRLQGLRGHLEDSFWATRFVSERGDWLHNQFSLWSALPEAAWIRDPQAAAATRHDSDGVSLAQVQSLTAAIEQLVPALRGSGNLWAAARTAGVLPPLPAPHPDAGPVRVTLGELCRGLPNEALVLEHLHDPWPDSDLHEEGA